MNKYRLLIVLSLTIIIIFVFLISCKNLLPERVILLNTLNNTLSSDFEILAKGDTVYTDKSIKHEILFKKDLKDENIRYLINFKNGGLKKYFKYENKELTLNENTYGIEDKKFTIEKIDYEINILERIIFLIFDNIGSDFNFEQQDDHCVVLNLKKDEFMEFASGFLNSIAHDPLIQEIIENEYKVPRQYKEDKSQIYNAKLLEFSKNIPIENIFLNFLIENNKVIKITYLINSNPMQSNNNLVKIQGTISFKY